MSEGFSWYVLKVSGLEQINTYTSSETGSNVGVDFKTLSFPGVETFSS